MNIFALDADPYEAAKAHVDKHVVKMPLETAQMLSTAHHVLDGKAALRGIYRATHKNHPCALWVRETDTNYLWTFELFRALALEYTCRYGKVHLSWKKLSHILVNLPANIPAGPLTPFAQAMPDEYIGPNAIDAYRQYYARGKPHLHSWRNRPQPEFIS